MSLPHRRVRNSAIIIAAIVGTWMANPAPASAADASTPPANGTLAEHPSATATGNVLSATPRYAYKAPPPTTSGQQRSPQARSGESVAATTTFLYGSASQYATSAGTAASLKVETPALAAADAHSLAEVAAQSADGQQIVEIGWTVDRATNGDANPHLFVYHWVDRTTSCYNGCGFVQSSATVRPGMTLTSGTTQTFAIQHYQNNWWVGLGSEWVGYFPDSLWGGRYTSTGLVQWFGEVAAYSAAPCTDMGNGLFSSNSSAASISGITFYSGPSVNISTNATNPSYYTATRTSSASMRYGGPGAC